MLNSNIKYPYPLLREKAEDFINSSFSGDIEILRENQGFRVVPHFSTNNEQINNLIQAGIFSYAVQIQCRSTYYRAVEYVRNNNSFFIHANKVHELVELCPCIISLKDYENYFSEDFVPAFKLAQVNVYKNDVVGIGNIIRFNAYYKADEVKNARSVITIQEDDSVEYIQIDMDHPNIIVKLPKSQHEAYWRIGYSTTDQVTLLTAIVSVPVIALALGKIDSDNDENDYAELPWYKSLRAQLDKLADGNPEKVEQLLEDKLQTAQRLLGNNLATSLNILDNRDW